MNTGHFVTDRPTQTKPYAQFWLAKSHYLAGNQVELAVVLRPVAAAALSRANLTNLSTSLALKASRAT